MAKTRIFLAIPHRALNETFFDETVYERIGSLGKVDRYEGSEPMTSEELARRIPGYEIIITGWGQVPFDSLILDAACSLKLIAHCGGSVAPYVNPDVYQRGIRVVSGNDGFAESVAESCIALMLASLRRIPFYDHEMKHGRWRGDIDTHGLFNKEVSLIGFGAIARFLTGMLQTFRCKVSAYDPFVPVEEMEAYGVTKIDLDQAFQSFDIVSIHLPQNDSTQGLVTAEHLSSMKQGALFVNTARASTVDEDALADLLHQGRIHAALDVYQTEPLPVDSPLRSAPNTILIPHMAGPTLDHRIITSQLVVDDVERFIDGEPLRHEISEAYAMQMTR